MRVIITYILVSICYVAVSGQGPLAGGFTPKRLVSRTEKATFTPLVMAELPALTGTDVNGFRFISVRTQVVDGINYLFLIELPDGKCSSVMFHRPLYGNDADLEMVSAEPADCPKS
ncbi:unnamed protein product [Calicophoron daubneyi]|uniref:Cystatin domain-containing protein n=1 Tax=Calicophoron daubneyi TaxID=300641 RepID=A0AAV2TIY5_CALDB